MKKLMLLILALMITLTILPSAYATPNQNINENRTEKRNAFELYGLYVKRSVVAVEKYGLSDYIDGDHLASFIMPVDFVDFSENDDEMQIYLPDFDITVEKDGLYVKEARIDCVMKYDKDGEKKRRINVLKTIIFMTALEYDELDESIIELEGKMYADYPMDVISKMNDIWDDNKIIDRISAVYRLKSQDEIKLYSGNYDYYISYKEMNDMQVEMLDVIAKAR